MSRTTLHISAGAFRPLLVAAGVASIFLVASSRARAQGPAPGPAANTIVYSSDQSGRFQLMAMALDGSNRRAIASTDGPAFENALTCNGRIATVVEVPGSNTHRLWTVNLDGSGLARLTDGPGDHMPTWRPDGFQIAFSSDPPDVDIHMVNADGSGRTQVTTDPVPEFWPHWSPDAGLFAIQYGQRNGPADIYTVTASGSAYRRLTMTGDALQPRWGPGGTEVVYARVNGTDADIWVVNRATGATRAVVTGPGYDHQPVWLPDGSRILFVRGSESSRGADIWSVQTDGSSPVNLTNTPSERDMWPATACQSKEPATATPPPPTARPSATPRPSATATAVRTATARPVPTDSPVCVCQAARRTVPAALIAEILADPAKAYGWGIPRDPNRKVGPRNPLRQCLSVQHNGLAYHPIYNRPVWRAGCP